MVPCAAARTRPAEPPWRLVREVREAASVQVPPGTLHSLRTVARQPDQVCLPGVLVKRPPLKRGRGRRTDTDAARAWAEAPGLTAPLLSVLDRSELGRVNRLESAYVVAHKHHVISRMRCRMLGVPEWDVRNRILVSENRHRRFHNRSEMIYRHEVPASVFDFLDDYPRLRPWFERTYPVSERKDRGEVT